MRWLALLACAVVACGTGTPGPGIDAERAYAHAAALAALGPHPGDTPQSQRALAYIEAQLEVMGVHGERLEVGGVDLPEIAVLGTIWRRAHHVETTDPDLLVHFGEPSDRKALLVMAHYDTVPASPGAVDNSAAVGILLELARVLRDRPLKQPVILAFTANEEIGLVGAESLAAHLAPDIDFAIALDLVGASGPLIVNGASTLLGSSELSWLADASERAGVALSAPPVHRVISRWWPQAERSDHGPFTRRGVRAIHLYNRGQDGERIDLAYHSPRDIAARVDRASLAAVGRLLVALADSPPPAHTGDGYWVPLTRLVVPRWLLLALEILLAAGAVALLVAREKGPRITGHGAGLALGILCYVAATALAIAVERLTAGDHPSPWLHAPLRAELAEGALLAGGLYLVTRLVARRWTWMGDRRYLHFSVIALLVFGVAWLALDAPELAWVWLVPAISVAAAPYLGRAAPVALAPALLPVVLVLAPDQLREAAWNNFLPPRVPLALWLAVIGAPAAAACAWLLRRTAPSPLRSLVLALGCGLAVLAGAVALATSHPTCSTQEFHDFHLACEQARTWP